MWALSSHRRILGIGSCGEPEHRNKEGVTCWSGGWQPWQLAWLCWWMEGEMRGGGDSDTITHFTSSVGEASVERVNEWEITKFYLFMWNSRTLRNPVGPKRHQAPFSCLTRNNKSSVLWFRILQRRRMETWRIKTVYFLMFDSTTSPQRWSHDK